MTTKTAPPVTQLPARSIPLPTSISPEAAFFLVDTDYGLGAAYPDLQDIEGWRAMIKAGDQTVLDTVGRAVADIPVKQDKLDIDGVTVYRVCPEGVDPDSRRVVLDIHGGGLIMGGGECCRAMAIGTAARLRALVWSVDYRMPPDHPYPAALDDCVAVYRALLRERRAEEIVIAGASAGGNIAAATILRARDEGLPLPAGAYLNTPEVDLTESGDSFQTNLGLDPVLSQSLMPANLLYAMGHDLKHPYLSPLFADFHKGFPPTFLVSGTRDLFLSNAVRMHRALRMAGVWAELHLFEAGAHIGFPGSPEGLAMDEEARSFLAAVWSKESRNLAGSR